MYVPENAGEESWDITSDTSVGRVARTGDAVVVATNFVSCFVGRKTKSI